MSKVPTRLVPLPVVDDVSGLRGTMPTVMSEQCATCMHWTWGLQCEAFPAGIPEAILSGERDHREPFPGDHGLRYEPIPGARS